MSPNLAKIAAQGRSGDTLLGHLTRGDVVVPEEMQTPQVKGLLASILGPKVQRYTAGSSVNSRNPTTGLPEFEGPDGGGNGEGGVGGDSGGGDTSGPADSSMGADSPAGRQGNPTGDPGDQGVANMGQGTVTGDVAHQTLGEQIGSAIANVDPVSAAINLGVGMVPGLGIANTLGGLVGIGTIGGAISHGLAGLSGGQSDNSTSSGGIGTGGTSPGATSGGNGGDGRNPDGTLPGTGLLAAVAPPAPTPAPAPLSPLLAPSVTPAAPIPAPFTDYWWRRALGLPA